MSQRDYESWQKSVIHRLWATTRHHGVMFYNNKPRIINGELWTPLCLIPDWVPLRQIVVWSCGVGVNLQPGAFAPAHEWILLFDENGFRLRNGKTDSAIGDVWHIPAASSDVHPAPFPEELPSRIISCTDGDMIFDPFCGSGTTLIAAKKLGRHFLGFEISPEYCEIARDRLARIDAQPSLFTPKPEQLELGQ